MNSLKPGVVLSPEFRVLRLLSIINGLSSLKSLKESGRFEDFILERMQKEGKIQIADDFVQMTTEGEKRFNELKPKFYRFIS